MPPVRTVIGTATGFDMQTSYFGLFHTTLTPAGGARTAIVMTQDGVEILNTSINNATPAVCETLINNALNGQLVGAGVTAQDFFSAVHIFTISPVSLAFIASNVPISGQWWLNA